MDYTLVFCPENLEKLFPSAAKTAAFFEALYGDAEEGAFAISLTLIKASPTRLNFGFALQRYPGQCLACNRTSGLPKVFDRHPVFNLNELSKQLAALAKWPEHGWRWFLTDTLELSEDLHLVPFILELNQPE